MRLSSTVNRGDRYNSKRSAYAILEKVQAELAIAFVRRVFSRFFHLEIAMSNTTSAQSGHAADSRELWQSLKMAIAASSGFQRWRSEQLSSVDSSISDEQLVRLYVLDTLETLAY